MGALSSSMLNWGTKDSAGLALMAAVILTIVASSVLSRGAFD